MVLHINDKRLFQDVLRATHIAHSFETPLPDPLEEPRGEFDKLRSQISLGNDNPDLLRELKQLSLDLFSNGLLSDDDMSEIMVL